MDNKTHNYIAVDLGAASGRIILGRLTDGKLELEELARFQNPLVSMTDHVYWDVVGLFHQITIGLSTVADMHLDIESIGIDTWGCDFMGIADDGTVLSNPVAYRDKHTEGAPADYFREEILSDEVYGRTGIQVMNFNSLFQIYTMRRRRNSMISYANKLLFIPDAISYLLTGETVCEYTIASTSQLINARERTFDEKILQSVGLTPHHFGRLVMPGTVIGHLTRQMQETTGLGAVPVVAVAGHDTASAVVAVPATNKEFVYLSSGTWSLMGVERERPVITDMSQKLNFSNEVGIEGTFRLLKNICGMWIYERCRAEWTDAPQSHSEILAGAMKQEAFRTLINPDAQCFANPKNMNKAIADYCAATGQQAPQGWAQTVRCILESLSLRYRQVMEKLQMLTQEPVARLHIIGGASQNDVLNQMTADSCNVTVVAGPVEATATGNIMMQAKAAGLVADRWEIRQIVAVSSTLREFAPNHTAAWDDAYVRFKKLSM